jgi:hypothetical protein
MTSRVWVSRLTYVLTTELLERYLKKQGKEPFHK